jgi:hypothetical protein
MARKIKVFFIIVSVGMLIYFASSANTLVAEDSENEVREKFADAMISVEASVVIVEPEALEEIIGEPDIKTLNSIPLEKIMQSIIEDEGGEMVSAVKLSVRNGAVAEMNAEDTEEEKRKISEEEETAEQENRERHVSFRATSHIIDMNKIVISFDFKQIFSESTLRSISETEEQGKMTKNFEVSSEVVLRPGQPRIVGATKKDEVIFLIMGVDI